jgi:hypothetical protein
VPNASAPDDFGWRAEGVRRAVNADGVTGSTALEPADGSGAASLEVALPPGNLSGPSGVFLSEGASIPAAFAGRAGSARSRLALSEGGSIESEEAVERALEWLVWHQFVDGSWSFEHGQSPRCRGRCGNEGCGEGRTGATGMALMCFLGAGYTHRHGPEPYREAVEKGLYYLISQMQMRDGRGDLRGTGIPYPSPSGSSVYCHGIATIALSEAYGMTGDRLLEAPAQAAVNFIVFFQNPQRGGWRYSIRSRDGDMSVTGFQIQALRSAQLSGLEVPDETIDVAKIFLDRLASHDGSRYGYTQAGVNELAGIEGGCAGMPSTTAIGLLCRMYTGWDRYHPAMHEGIRYLSRTGPSLVDMYYNYYATVVMRHWGGEEWKQWNAATRDFITGRQARHGHEAGSWAPFGAWGKQGGRLMDTAFCCMTLEVYYRYMPLYDSKAVRDAFANE